MFIYLIQNKTTNRVYIGQTRQHYLVRWNRHKRQLNHNIHENPYFQHSWNKYGPEDFSWVILDWCVSSFELNEVEKEYIRLFKNLGICFNVQDGGPNTLWSNETRKKMSDSLLGRHNSPETRKKISEANLGKKRTEETCRRISEGKRGVPVSDEHKRKISETLKGRPLSQETKDKMSKSHMGEKFTDERREKISRATKGRIFTDEHKQKLSEARKRRFKLDKSSELTYI